MMSLLMTSLLLEICKQTGWRPGIVIQRLKNSMSISLFDRQIFNNFVAAVIRETSILVILSFHEVLCIDKFVKPDIKRLNL